MWEDRVFGIRTIEEIPADAMIIEYVSKVTHIKIKGHYVMLFGEGFVINANDEGNVDRFVNHSCNPKHNLTKRKRLYTNIEISDTAVAS
ncbi:hypothetical protein CDV36_015031 [Fusarium kuroshium]|uniref:SET domain-containing protein n=2 Tax=Fusarium solani species complex TaxID=232080 RepID=A0A3M2RDQ4_9HYPO|nr:hypothetical protein CDV36_015031 [Fusarium kuroshium]